MKFNYVAAFGLIASGLVLARPAAAEDAVDGAAAADPSAESATVPSAKEPTAEAPKEPTLQAEHKRAPNSVYAEGLGAGLVYSFNYERLVVEDLGVRGGISYMSFSANAGSDSASATFITVPVTASYLGVGSKRNMLEIGGGMTFAYAGGSASGVGYSSSGSGLTVLPDVLIGYRLHPVDGAGFQFRVGAMAFVGKGLGFDVNDPDKIGVLPWFYLSLGASF